MSEAGTGGARAAAGPLRRPMGVERLLRERQDVVVEASEDECRALAADLGIPGIRDLVGRFRVSGSPTRLQVAGTVEACVSQTCTVSLEPFETRLHEAVDVDFSDGVIVVGGESETVEVPDPIVGGRIDFGALTAEFVALGLDPFPRRPGIVFEPVSAGADASPFAVLRRPRDGE